MVCVIQGQRAGVLPADHVSLFPGLSWKQEGYTDVCQTYLNSALEAADASAVDFQNFPGYFEAGSALRPSYLMFCLKRLP